MEFKMKNYLRIIGLVWAITLMTVVPVYASIFPSQEYTSIEEDSSLLPPTAKDSRDLVRKTPRGVFFSAAELQIINEDGEIGVLGSAYMSTEIDELYMTIYLDRLTDEGRWEQVDYFEFEFYSDDYPDGLTSEFVSFTLTGYPKGHYYRLRGTYAAVKDGVIEGFGPTTDGILIQ